MLGPNVALAFGTTLGDVDLIRRSLRTALIGFALALALTVLFGVVLPMDVMVGEVLERTRVQLSDVAVALAAGVVGALAITSAIPSSLVGVMVAVALLPPTVAVGLMLGKGQWTLASGAAMLLATNIICVNLAGVSTFLLQGIRPRRWWERRLAQRSARRALLIWICLLTVLTILILFSPIGKC